ncbi:hypothetical protein GGX14DRAFT_346994 [Mycena pura]|uniref:Uncharacterized protein n=1 Tax=Mycena pura TaxID=153505 RepID=A0AAD7E5V4_9AGAR|nr:hypothetical protein GGX14DRAFT_346994 [Mycena pura]
MRQPQGAPPPRRPHIPRALSSSALPPHLSTAGISGSLGKSSVARPVITSPVEGSTGSTSTQAQNGSAGRGVYRPKGPPAELEYDDDDESDADGRGKGKERASDGGLQVSKSVAQEKLRVLAEKSAILSRAKNGPGSDADATVAERRRLYEQAGSTSTAPVGFPYYLPAPEPPSTPRTTRKHMLRNEMSESLRYNLLWQRKLSRTELTGPQPRRTRSTVHVPSAEKSLVRVTPRAPGAERRDAPLPPMDQPVLEGAPKKKLVRNLSWANTSDFHWKGY